MHNYVLKKIREASGEYKNITFRICSTHSLESATNLKELLETSFPNSKITFIDYLGPVFSIHVGYKGYGVSWFGE